MSCLFLLHLLVKKFGHQHGWLIWELQILIKSGMNCLSRHIMTFPSLPFDNRLYLRSLQGLVMTDLLDNFLKLLNIFSGCGEIISWNHYNGELEGVRRERYCNCQINYSQSGESWRKGLKQKLLQKESTVKHIYSYNLSDKGSARYFRCPGSKETYIVHPSPTQYKCNNTNPHIAMKLRKHVIFVHM